MFFKRVYSIFLLLVLACVTLWTIRALVGKTNSTYRHSPADKCMQESLYVGFAIADYYEINGCYPFSDFASNHLISWRVLLEDHLQKGLYPIRKRDVTINKAWWTSENADARRHTPSPFYCPCKSSIDGETSIVAVRSKRGCFSPNGNIATDDPDDNLIFVKIANSGINWLEPRDIEESELSTVEGCHVRDGKKCITVGMASGKVYLLTLENFRQIYPALIDVNSGKKFVKTKDGFITTIFVCE